MTHEIEHNENAPTTKSSGGFARWLVIGTIGLAAVSGIGIANAVGEDLGRYAVQAAWGGQGGWGGMGHGRGHGFMRILGELDLTDEQEDKIWEIADGVRKDARPVMREFRDSREDLAKLLGAATVDAAAVETLRAQRVADVDAMSKKVTAGLIAAANVLTPEQRAKLLEEIEDHHSRGRW